MEIMCYGQLAKLCYLLHHKLLTDNVLNDLYPVATMLSDKYISLFFDKFNMQPKIKYVIASGKTDKIIPYLTNVCNNKLMLFSKSIIKNLMKLDEIDLIKMIIIPKDYLPELLSLCLEEDMLEIYNYLVLINSH